MDANLVNQNKNLKEAAKTPRDTSGQKQQARKYSAQVASEKKKNVAQESKAQVKKSSGKVVRGSFEGYMYARAAHIQPNNSGYAAKSNQTARYGKNYSNNTLNNFTNNSFSMNKNYSIMNNYTSRTIENSSSDRLSKIVKNNMDFK